MNVPDKGGLIRPSVFTGSEGVVAGDEKSFGDAGSKTGFDPGAPVWLDGAGVGRDDVSAMGAIAGDTKSDPMFDKFASDARASGSESPDSVAGASMPSGSDPMFQEVPHSDDANKG